MSGHLEQLNELTSEEKRDLLAELLRREVSKPERFPLSFAQQRLWFLAQYEPDNPSYNVPQTLRLKGELDIAALERTINLIIARHGSLRTTFEADNGEPVQIVSKTKTISLPISDLTALAKARREEEARRLATEAAQHPFDLTRDCPLRALLVRLTDDEYLLSLTMHHIVSDAWSMGILTNELSTIYAALVKKETPLLTELPIQYWDFAQWQRSRLQGDLLKNELAYWKNQLAGAPAALILPTDRHRPPIRSSKGASVLFRLPKELSESIKDLTQQEGATIFMTLLAAFKVLLFRYSGQDDIVVGSPIAGRNRMETEGLIGFFVNSLALRTDLSGNPRFRELLSRVKEVAFEAYAHQDLPFEKLVEELNPVRDVSRTPVFQVMFGLQNAPRAAASLQNVTITRIPTTTETAKFDLTLLMSEGTDGLSGWLEYNTDVFNESTIKRLAEHFEVLLEGIVSHPEQRISTLPLMSEAERNRLLVEWNNTATRYPKSRCIQQLFEERVERSPGSIALLFGGKTMTYADLNKRANQLAHHLRKIGVGPEVVVGVAMERSFEMVVALLGILKAGGAYLPLDLSSPRARVLAILEDAKVDVVLIQENYRDKLPQQTAVLIALDSNWFTIAVESDKNPDCSVTSKNLAYVMYTSGSTGKPKAVSVTHKSVVRLVKETNYAKFGPDEVFLQFAPISFDASTFEIWGSLLNGACLVVLPPGLAPLEELGETVKSHGVTTLWLTAGLFHQMVETQLDKLRGVRQLLAGGDVLSVPHVERVARELNNCRLINGYGPTENTTFTCCQVVNGSELASSVPIGRPISNTHVYVLGRDLEPVPIGVAGELYVGGDGLARGYRGDPETTADKFVPNPFSVKPGARLYRTGDEVRYRGDGSLEFLQRLDHQVKVRGYRIELGEVEDVLSRHRGVRKCVVTAQSLGTSEKRLVAYIEPVSTVTSSLEELRSFLREKLPEYMVPSFFVRVDQLPLTPNGKVDRQALPKPEASRDDEQQSFEEPRTDVERQLALVWTKLLGVEQISVHDNFFDLGGHSLLAVRLVVEIEKEFGRKIPLISLFQAGTIKSLAALLSQDVTSQAWPTLVQIQVANSQHPLFCVSAPNVNALGYISLARNLGSDKSVYGLQAQYPFDAEAEHSQIIVEQVASEYLAAMRSQQATGPYHLVGMCRGAHIAYEIARRLQEEGETVGLLGILDTFVMENTYNYFWYVEQYLGRVKTLLHLPLNEKLSFIRTRWRRALRNVRRARRDLLRVYFPGPDFVPKTYAGRVAVFRVAKQPRNRISDPRLGWGKLARGGVDVYYIPGSHETLLREPSVRFLARELKGFFPSNAGSESSSSRLRSTQIDGTV